MKYKKEVIAIAKNESAYLALWCAHYTELGFDKITIYLNGIDDHSYLLMDEINRVYPHVEVRNSDSFNKIKNFDYDYLIDGGFLTRNPMQSRAYAEAYKISGDNGFDYILFVDIDEYLTPRKSKVTIDEVLEKYNEPEFLKFKWFNLSTRVKEFSFPLSSKVFGRQSNVTKYLLKTNLQDVKFINTHIAKTSNKRKRYLSGLGKIIEHNSSEIEQSVDNEFVLLHDLYRSEVEYLATLFRGDFIFKSSHGIKLNRKGWVKDDENTINISPDVVERFKSNYYKLLNQSNIETYVDIAQGLIKIKATKLEHVCMEIYSEYKSIKKILKGTSIEF